MTDDVILDSGTASTESVTISETRFIDTLPEDIRSESSLQNFKDASTLAKSYVSAQKMLGSSVRIPSVDASDEARNEFYAKVTSIPGVVKLPDPTDEKSLGEFYNKLGRPETAESYKFNTPENVALDTGSVDSFKALAHKVGLTNAQANAIMEFELGRNADVMSGVASTKEASMGTLKDAFGNDYDNRIAAAKNAVNHFGAKYPDAMKSLVGSAAGNNPIVIMMAAELGKLYQESGVITGDRNLNFGVSADEARARIAEIRANPKHAYFNDRDPGHAQAVNYVEKLYNSVYT